MVVIFKFYIETTKKIEYKYVSTSLLCNVHVSIVFFISHSISPNTLVLLASSPMPLGSGHSLQIAVDCAPCASCAGYTLCTAVNAAFWRSRSVQPAVPEPLDHLSVLSFTRLVSLYIALLFLCFTFKLLLQGLTYRLPPQCLPPLLAAF